MGDKRNRAGRSQAVQNKLFNLENEKRFEECYTRVDKHASSSFFKILILHNYPEVHLVTSWADEQYPDPNNNVEAAGKLISNGMFSVECLVRTIKISQAHDLVDENGKLRRRPAVVVRRPTVPFKVDEIKTKSGDSRSPFMERAVLIMAYYLLPGVVDNLEVCYQLKNAITDEDHMKWKRKQKDTLMGRVEFEYLKYVEDDQIADIIAYLGELKIDWDIWVCSFAIAREVILYDEEVMELYDSFVIDVSGKMTMEKQRSSNGKHTMKDLYEVCCAYTKENLASQMEMDMFKYLLIMLIGDYEKKAMWNGLLYTKYVNLFRKIEEARLIFDEGRFEKNDQNKKSGKK